MAKRQGIGHAAGAVRMTNYPATLTEQENLLPGIELVNGDCAAVLPELPPADLILTSPPYDNLREYGGYNDAFDFDAIAAACVANLAPGGVLVWVVRGGGVDGGDSGTSFRQALGFKALGLTLHQTMIYERSMPRHEAPTRYNKSLGFSSYFLTAPQKQHIRLQIAPTKLFCIG